MDPRMFGNCEAKVCSDSPAPITPMHEMLLKMNALAIDIRDTARFIDSSLLPSYNARNEPIPTTDYTPDNMHDHIRTIVQTLAIANDTLMRIRDCL